MRNLGASLLPTFWANEMLKALFLDMDDTLCDTQGANREATQTLAAAIERNFGDQIAGVELAGIYVDGIYRRWTESQRVRYEAILANHSEEYYRICLMQDVLLTGGVDDVTSDTALALVQQFDQDRLDNFNFYPGIKAFLLEARNYFKLVVITNGPEHSQLPKLETVKMKDLVDFVLVGGQEPEQKPAASIFYKALRLVKCEAHEVVHVGDSLAADIQGAHNSGITSIWIQHQQPLDAELGLNPHHTVLHPSEIPDKIRALHPF